MNLHLEEKLNGIRRHVELLASDIEQLEKLDSICDEDERMPYEMSPDFRKVYESVSNEIDANKLYLVTQIVNL